jgi:hypothetical protein
MAVKYTEILKAVTSKPLTSDELALVKDVEKYIDNRILEEFDYNHNHEIYIDDSYYLFSYSPLSKKKLEGVGIERKRLMTNELRKRFEDAGWEWNTRDENYVRLKGKTLR